MTRHKPVIPRALAENDIDAAIAHYLDAGGADLALRFIDDLEAAFQHVSTHPATGSPRYATELDLPGLRIWPLRDFPQLIFYVEQADHLDVWRVLHGRRDIPAWLQDGG
ncbi:MAG: type II toxin-antitoxin system RelE/ParE family toxin [Salinisphaera sp.]|nr:type II toxin-antitoxin system RelE/ParE family toxin [Salinisphaera sp.]